MNWEVLNGVTGIISAICAVVSIGYFSTHSKEDADEAASNMLTVKQIMSFLLVCSGWVLWCLSFLWFFEPYGSFISHKDYRNFLGVILALLALIVFIYGINQLQGRENEI